MNIFTFHQISGYAVRHHMLQWYCLIAVGGNSEKIVLLCTVLIWRVPDLHMRIWVSVVVNCKFVAFATKLELLLWSISDKMRMNKSRFNSASRQN